MDNRIIKFLEKNSALESVILFVLLVVLFLILSVMLVPSITNPLAGIIHSELEKAPSNYEPDPTSGRIIDEENMFAYAFRFTIECDSTQDYLAADSMAYSCKYYSDSIGGDRPTVFNLTALKPNIADEANGSIIIVRWIKITDGMRYTKVVTSCEDTKRTQNHVNSLNVEKITTRGGNSGARYNGKFCIFAPPETGRYNLEVSLSPQLIASTPSSPSYNIHVADGSKVNVNNVVLPILFTIFGVLLTAFISVHIALRD